MCFQYIAYASSCTIGTAVSQHRSRSSTNRVSDCATVNIAVAGWAVELPHAPCYILTLRHVRSTSSSVLESAMRASYTRFSRSFCSRAHYDLVAHELCPGRHDLAQPLRRYSDLQATRPTPAPQGRGVSRHDASPAHVDAATVQGQPAAWPRTRAPPCQV